MTVWMILEWAGDGYLTRHLCGSKEIAKKHLLKYIKDAYLHHYFESEDEEEEKEYNKYVDIITNWKTEKSLVSQKDYINVWNYQACEMTIEED